MQSLDPNTIPLNDSNLIEASAGTGKTYTISLLYLRFILESEPQLSVDQLLVVTYTIAATKELKDRIRTRLNEALIAFSFPELACDEYRELCLQYANHTDAIFRLYTALLNFDEAAIFTIHSFCQRALKETAFDSGLGFDNELLDDQSELMQSLLDDYWRKMFQQAPNILLLLLQTKNITPDSLLNDIQNVVGKPYLKRLRPDTDFDIQQLTQTLEQTYQLAIKTYQQQLSEITALLTHFKQENYFNKHSVSDKKVDAMIKEMAILLSDHFESPPAKLPQPLEGLSQDKLKLKKSAPAISHCFFTQWQHFIEAKAALDHCVSNYHDVLRNDALDYLHDQLPLEKRRKGILSFDDLLLQLDLALESNTALAPILLAQYPVAMIDEFQDTDPIQYAIFQKIYGASHNGDHTVFFVGDPKQAIYSFRGADIYTYQKASKDTQHQYTLNKNWRSHPKLIDALNCLFTRNTNPFIDENISYQSINAGQQEEPALVTDDERAPLRLWTIDTLKQEGQNKTIADLKEEIAQRVAQDITQLLTSADKGNAMIADRALEGGDIAVLVRSHKQGQQIKAALTQCGVASVQSAKESIFKTHEAQELMVLLMAIAQPAREDQVRRALVTDLFAYRADDLIDFDENNTAWDNKLHAFQHWHQLWLVQGFIPMMRHLMRDESIPLRLLSHDNGERRLTNLLHIAELIHHESHQNSRGMEGVIRWLQQQAEHSNLSSDYSQLRLESDDKLVKIVTIHKSKGLEYNIVYCPYLWSDGLQGSKDPAILFHNDEHIPCVDIGSTQRKAHIKRFEEEVAAENMRLLYVALTRAKYHCTVVTAPQKIVGYIDRSALGWLLSQGTLAGSKAFFPNYQETLETLAEVSQDAIEVKSLPENTPLEYQRKTTTPRLHVRLFSSSIQQDHRITSFSALSYGHHSETADHDQDIVFNSYLKADTPAEFPRGSRAGSCLHDIYEHIDFTQPLATNEESVIINALTKWGFDLELADTAQTLLSNSLQAPLFASDPDFKLSNLSTAQRLNEMEFVFPLALLKIDQLKPLLITAFVEEHQHVIRHAINSLDFQQVRGYLKGYIDLIFEYNGKYYIADYKSNHLEDYGDQSLLSAMAHSHYYLQYLIYTVALHRYLTQRLTNYHYKTHFGGVYYLFIRGMSEDHPNQGVFYNQPDYQLICALDTLFGTCL